MASTLVIGLGGSGVKIAGHLKARVHEAGKAGDYSFLFIDSDTTEREVLRRTHSASFSRDANFIDFNNEWIHLGGVNPLLEYKTQGPPAGRTAPCRYVEEWLDPKVAETFPNEQISAGLLANRPLGRWVFALRAGRLESKLQGAIEGLSAHHVKDEKGEVHDQKRIVLISGSCGGTGSSSFFDLCFMISAIHQGIHSYRPDLRPVVVSPKPIIEMLLSQKTPEEQVRRVRANAYAFFSEIDFALNNRYSGGKAARLFANPKWPRAAQIDELWEPFSSLMLVDRMLTTQSGKSDILQLEDIYPLAADILFYAGSSELDSVLGSIWINSDLPSTKRESPHGMSYSHMVVGGVRAVEYPSIELRQYLDARFALYIGDRYLGGDAAARQESGRFEREAQALVSKIKSELVGFSEDAKRQLLSEDLLESYRSISPYMADGEISPANCHEPSADARMRSATEEVDRLRDQVRRLFTDRFREPMTLATDDKYGRINAMLGDAMTACVEKYGMDGWLGPFGQPERGMLWHLENALGAEAKRAREAVATSNSEAAKLKSEIGGLEELKAGMVLAAGSLEKAWLLKGPERKQLANACTRFAAKLADRVQAGFENELIIRESEVWTVLGAAGSPEWLDVYCGKPIEQSVVKQVRERSREIREWLMQFQERAQGRVDVVAGELTRKRASLSAFYVPPLTDIMKDDGSKEPGAVAEQSLRALRGNKRSLAELLQRVKMSDADWPRMVYGMRSLDMSLTEALEAAVTAEVTAEVKFSPSLAAHLAEAGSTAVEACRTALAATNVPVLAQVSGRVLGTAQNTLSFVSAEDKPDQEDAVAHRLGYKKREHGWLPDPAHPSRVLALQFYKNIYVEDFLWFGDNERAYADHIGYEPHLWKNGRAMVTLSGSLDRVESAFAAAFAWAVYARGTRSTSIPEVKSIFCDQSIRQPESYLHDPPLRFGTAGTALQSLRVSLSPSCINAAGRLEARVTEAQWEAVSEGAEGYAAAFSKFAKQRRNVENAEFFLKVAAGISVTYDGDGAPVLAVVEHGEQRARHFLEVVVPYVQERVEKKRVEYASVPSDEARRERGILGAVFNRLQELVNGLSGPGARGGVGVDPDGI